MSIKVKNLIGTSDKNCTCAKGDSSWIKHYELQKTLPYSCRNMSCNNAATLGGHVKKIGANDDSHYITPLCDSCNKLTDEFNIVDGSLVSATCN